MGALAALGESLGLFAVLSTLAAGSVLAAIAFISGSSGWETVAGWVFVFSAGFAWYTASAMMLASVMGRTILPLGKYSRSANVPGRTPTTAVELEYGEPRREERPVTSHPSSGASGPPAPPEPATPDDPTSRRR